MGLSRAEIVLLSDPEERGITDFGKLDLYAN